MFTCTQIYWFPWLQSDQGHLLTWQRPAIPRSYSCGLDTLLCPLPSQSAHCATLKKKKSLKYLWSSKDRNRCCDSDFFFRVSCLTYSNVLIKPASHNSSTTAFSKSLFLVSFIHHRNDPVSSSAPNSELCARNNNFTAVRVRGNVNTCRFKYSDQ